MILLILDTSLASRGSFSAFGRVQNKGVFEDHAKSFYNHSRGGRSFQKAPSRSGFTAIPGGRGFWKVGTSKRLPEAVLQAPRRPEASGRLPEAVLHPLIGLPKAPSL